MKKILSLFALAAIVLSCTDDDIRTEQNFGDGPKVVGFTPSFQTVSYFADQGIAYHEFPLDLIGQGNGQYSSTDIQVSYEIDPASTAVSGVEYNMVETSGMITIPAGESFGTFPLEVNTGSLDPVQKTELILNLTSTSNGSVIGEQYKQLKIIFVGCLSQLEGSYTATISTTAGTSVRSDEYITLTAINTFQTRYVGRYGFGTFTPAGYQFIDICGEITVPNQSLGQYSNEVRGVSEDGVDGTVTSPTTFEVVHEITFATGNQNQNYSYVRN